MKIEEIESVYKNLDSIDEKNANHTGTRSTYAIRFLEEILPNLVAFSKMSKDFSETGIMQSRYVVAKMIEELEKE